MNPKPPLRCAPLAALLSCCAGAAFAVAPQAVPDAPIRLVPGAATTQALVDTLAERDRALFDAVFGCRLDALRPMIADDFEFLHDKHGRIAGSGAEFLADVAAGCERQAAGSDFRARRELVPGTLQTFALAGYGAVQLGTHRFYALRTGEPDRLTETGRFVDVWKLEGGAWKLSRAISYGHELAAPGQAPVDAPAPATGPQAGPAPSDAPAHAGTRPCVATRQADGPAGAPGAASRVLASSVRLFASSVRLFASCMRFGNLTLESYCSTRGVRNLTFEAIRFMHEARSLGVEMFYFAREVREPRRRGSLPRA